MRWAVEGRGARVGGSDLAVAGGVLAVEAAVALLLPESDVSHRPDLLGWALLAGSSAVLVWRRRAPMWCLLGMVVTVAPYHYLQYVQQAPIVSSMVALFALAVAGPPVRTYVVVPSVVLTMTAVMSTIGKPHAGSEMLQSAGWIVAVAVAGDVVRIHRNYVAAIMERAERAERTREQEAARRVAEERLRIARDLHDLLAHSITLIGVQTSVAAHVLVADPERLDRTAVASALDAIADTCREARAELRTTLRVLRTDGDGPLPDLAGLASLAGAAEAAGARVELAVDVGGEPVPPAVGAAAYRIVQESLTNAVRHTGAAQPLVTVRVGRHGGGLRLEVRDDGGREDLLPAPRADAHRADPHGTDPDRRPEGFGIAGMRERARSVGGTLAAGPCQDGPGFAVTADLPFAADLQGDPR
ncbi:sensor histidine kinase [Actinacidiphila rubida]|uniref:sensor histidine kinase n=1 Tax=Actinacidiphila rubida TaxID=310780 RepID=UPI001FE7254F|nr:sensor histidine kinase [Actinacidiphila rubida]